MTLSRVSAIATLALALALVSPRTAAADNGTESPAAVKWRPQWGLVAGGAGLFGLGYAGQWMLAQPNPRHPTPASHKVPVLGLALVGAKLVSCDLGGPDKGPNCPVHPALGVVGLGFVAIVTALQIGGLVVMGIGLSATEKVPTRSIRVTPYFDTASAGLTGTF